MNYGLLSSHKKIHMKFETILCCFNKCAINRMAFLFWWEIRKLKTQYSKTKEHSGRTRATRSSTVTGEVYGPGVV